MKRMKIGLFLAAILYLPAIAQIPTPVPGWPYISRCDRWGEYAIAQLGYDSGEQYLYFNTLTGEIDKFLMDRSFFPGWPVVSDTTVFECTPIIVDIDRDGRNEVVTVGDRVDINRQYCYSLIYIVDDDGSAMPGWPVRVQWPTLNVADLDGDNEYEIICYSIIDDLIYCFGHDGNLKPGWPISFHLPGVEDGYTPHQGAIGDLDLDGMNEFILSGAWDIFAFKFDGSMMPGFHVNLPDTAYVFYNAWKPPALADFNSDGYLEIITSGNNWSLSNPNNFTSFVAVYDHQGNIEDGWPLNLPSQLVCNAVTPSDIDSDGILEIGIKTGVLTFIHFNGDVLPGWPSGRVNSNDDLIIVDLDGDRNCEIFLDNNSFDLDSLGYFGWLYGLDRLGQFLPGYPIRIRGSNLGLPPSFALNQVSHRLYMGLVDEAFYPDEVDIVSIELFQFPDSTGPTTEWPMQNHDNLQTRNYNFVDRVTSIGKPDEVLLPKNPVLKQNYPNPFNLFTMIEFSLPKEGHITLSLYDILGRKIADLYDATLPAGSYKRNVELDVSSGVYFYCLRAENTQITRKMTLLK